MLPGPTTLPGPTEDPPDPPPAGARLAVLSGPTRTSTLTVTGPRRT